MLGPNRVIALGIVWEMDAASGNDDSATGRAFDVGGTAVRPWCRLGAEDMLIASVW